MSIKSSRISHFAALLLRVLIENVINFLILIACITEFLRFFSFRHSTPKCSSQWIMPMIWLRRSGALTLRSLLFSAGSAWITGSNFFYYTFSAGIGSVASRFVSYMTSFQFNIDLKIPSLRMCWHTISYFIHSYNIILNYIAKTLSAFLQSLLLLVYSENWSIFVEYYNWK